MSGDGRSLMEALGLTPEPIHPKKETKKMVTRTPAVLARDLKRAHGKVQNAIKAQADAKAQLLEAVGHALEAGWTLQQIAEAIGVSRSRAHELARQTDGRGRWGRAGAK